MPNGVVRWVDAKREVGRLSRFGKGYAFRRVDAERDAFTPDARVHFDLERREGARWAVNVRLRRGTRTSRHQHRFGEQAGVHTRARPLELDPAALAERWLRDVQRGEVAAAVDLYAPEARLHNAGETCNGRDRILRYLADNPVAGPNPCDITTKGEGEGVVHLRWRRTTNGRWHGTRLRVVRGEIVEQWI